MALALHPIGPNRAETQDHRAATTATTAATAPIASPSCSESATRWRREDRLRHDGGSDRELHRDPGLRPRILFASGQATVLDGFKPVAARVAATLDKEPGASGSSAIPTARRSAPCDSRRTSNCRSSAPRPSAAVLKHGLTDSSRVDIEGKGADAPIAHQHDTGRARQEPACRDLHRAQRIAEPQLMLFATGTGQCWPRTLSASFFTGSGSARSRRVIYFAGPLHRIRRLASARKPRSSARSSVLLLMAARGELRRLQLLSGGEKDAEKIAEGISGAEQPVNDEPVLKERMKDALATLKTASGGKSGYPLRSALVRHHRPAGRGQDHGAGQFRAEVSARARGNAGGDRRRRRHPLLRLVVHRRGRADRHRRPLHDAGLRRKSRQGKLVRLPRHAEEEPPAPADQRRDRRHQRRGPADAAEAGTRRARRSRSGRACSSCTSGSRSISRSMRSSPRPISSPASPNISAISARPAGVRSGARPSRPPTRRKNLVGEIPDEFDHLLERLSEETLDRLQDEPTPQHRVQLFGFPDPDGAAQAADLRLSQPDFRADALSRQRQPARVLLHLGHPAGHADRPVDRLAGAHASAPRRSRARAIPAPARATSLTDLISKVIIGEADWVSTDRAAVRRALIIKTAALSPDRPRVDRTDASHG